MISEFQGKPIIHTKNSFEQIKEFLIYYLHEFCGNLHFIIKWEKKSFIQKGYFSVIFFMNLSS